MPTNDEFDKILESVGDTGRYQTLLVWGFYLYIGLIIPFVILVPIFLTAVPDHWCYVEGKPDNVTTEQWKNWTIPRIKHEDVWRFSKCEQFELPNDTEFSQFHVDRTISVSNVGWNTTSCQNGLKYDHTYYDETLSMKNGWVCENGAEGSAWLTAGQAGKMVGILIFSRLSDIVGRKPVLLIIPQLYAVFSLLLILFPGGIQSYCITFIATLAFPSVLHITFIWVAEQVGNSWRTHVNAMSSLTWTVSMSALPLLAWLTRNWINLTVATAVPFFLLAFIVPFIPESSRWLASRGRVNDATSALMTIAKINKKSIPTGLKQSVQFYFELKKTGESIQLLDFFRSRHMCKYFFLLTGCWIANMLVYYGLSYNVSYLGGNQFLNFFLMAVVEAPSAILAWISCQTVGRRITQMSCFLMVAVTLGITVVVKTPSGIETIISSVICKILISGSFFAFYLQAVEIFPTSHRSSAMGLTCVTASIFGISSPYMAYSSAYWTRLPFLIFTIMALFGFVCAFFVPETLQNSLPQNVRDSENYYANAPLLSYEGRHPREWKNAILGQSSEKRNCYES